MFSRSARVALVVATMVGASAPALPQELNLMCYEAGRYESWLVEQGYEKIAIGKSLMQGKNGEQAPVVFWARQRDSQWLVTVAPMPEALCVLTGGTELKVAR